MTSWLRPVTVRVYRMLKKSTREYRVPRKLSYWKACAESVVEYGRSRANAGLDVLNLSPTQRHEVEEEARRAGIAVIATVDQDGYWQSRIGEIPGLPSSGEFLARSRPLEIVWTPAYFGVRKRFAGSVVGFVNELSALDRLGRCNMRVPSILDIDFAEPSIVMSYIPGAVLRDELVRVGAPVRNRDRIRGLSHIQNIQRTLVLGRQALLLVVTHAFIAELVTDLEQFHALGVMMPDINWGNIIIGKDGNPWWIDFHVAEDHSELSRESFQVLANFDMKRFNLAFSTGAVSDSPDVTVLLSPMELLQRAGRVDLRP